MKAIAVIPARYGSTRFPGKPLADIAGKTLIERVYNQTIQARNISEVLVATDDKRIFDEIASIGGKAVMTSDNHPSGTDRIAEAVKDTDFDVVVNVQGDEPLIPPELIDELAGQFEKQPGLKAVTAAHKLYDHKLIESPDAVKVAIDYNNYAETFSRSSLNTYCRGKNGLLDYDGKWPGFLKHVGIYGFTRETLFNFVGWKPSPLEVAEKLEQMRLVENGVKIKVLITSYEPVSVDTHEDIKKVLEILKVADEA
ncbi:MAG: 3-deoxy-manno-octulosonate cytidylyltransferase [candidate division Zixibacteria bacterium]|nr:3-deoxy-manno-octulosonate cytidylyltransferase [candidate division Zixibacteria bacterium]